MVERRILCTTIPLGKIPFHVVHTCTTSDVQTSIANREDEVPMFVEGSFSLPLKHDHPGHIGVSESDFRYKVI